MARCVLSRGLQFHMLITHFYRVATAASYSRPTRLYPFPIGIAEVKDAVHRWYLELFKRLQSRGLLDPGIKLHKFCVRYLCADLIDSDLQFYKQRHNAHSLRGLGGVGGTGGISPTDMWEMRWCPPDADPQWRSMRRPLTAQDAVDLTEIADHFAIDEDAANEKYLPDIVIELFRGCLCDIDVAEKVTRRNVEARLTLLLYRSLTMAQAPGVHDFDAWIGRAAVDPDE